MTVGVNGARKAHLRNCMSTGGSWCFRRHVLISTAHELVANCMRATLLWHAPKSGRHSRSIATNASCMHFGGLKSLQSILINQSRRSAPKHLINCVNEENFHLHGITQCLQS